MNLRAARSGRSRAVDLNAPWGTSAASPTYFGNAAGMEWPLGLSGKPEDPWKSSQYSRGVRTRVTAEGNKTREIRGRN